MKNKLMSASLLTSVFLALLFVAASYASGQQLDLISNVTLEADHTDYSGPCPKDIHLKGTFKVNEAGLGIVNVQYVHSDGTSGEPRPLTVNDKGVYTFEANLRQTYSWSDQVYLRV